MALKSLDRLRNSLKSERKRRKKNRKIQLKSSEKSTFARLSPNQQSMFALIQRDQANICTASQHLPQLAEAAVISRHLPDGKWRLRGVVKARWFRLRRALVSSCRFNQEQICCFMSRHHRRVYGSSAAACARTNAPAKRRTRGGPVGSRHAGIFLLRGGKHADPEPRGAAQLSASIQRNSPNEPSFFLPFQRCSFNPKSRYFKSQF